MPGRKARRWRWHGHARRPCDRSGALLTLKSGLGGFTTLSTCRVPCPSLHDDKCHGLMFFLVVVGFRYATFLGTPHQYIGLRYFSLLAGWMYFPVGLGWQKGDKSVFFLPVEGDVSSH